jgi:inosine/xanthosine triphosphatase
MRLAIASKNPAKINAIKSAFSEVFSIDEIEVFGFETNSGVALQPMSSRETLYGALNRLKNLVKKNSLEQIDFYVSIEAGIEMGMNFAWIIISDTEKIGISRSASLPIPKAILNKLSPTKDLGSVIDELYGTKNIKNLDGAIGILTKQKLNREQVYKHSVILALSPFISEEIYF